MASLVLVPGALHGAWAWEGIVPLLAAQGHRVYAPDLPGTEREPSIPTGAATLRMWTDSLVDVIRQAGEPVHLVAHSRGGLVIGEAAEVVPELVRGLIYVTALIVPPGRTTPDVMGPQTSSQQLEFSEDRASFTMQPELATSLFYNACTPEQAEWAVRQLRPEPLAIMTTPASVTWARWGRLPRAFVECTEDRTLSLEQQIGIQAAAPCNPVRRIAADHSPFLSAPDALVNAITEIIAQWNGVRVS